MVCIKFCPGRQLEAYACKDTDPYRVPSIPISILHCLNATYQGGTTIQQAITDLDCIYFLILLRPGEYFQEGTDTVSTSFCVQYIQLYVDRTPPPSTTATAYNCATASFISLLFTTQKNEISGKSIGHRNTGSPQSCALAAIRRCVVNQQRHGASSHTLLEAVSKNWKWSTISGTEITKALWEAVKIAGPQVSFKPIKVSARLIQAGGAMALLLSRETKWRN